MCLRGLSLYLQPANANDTILSRCLTSTLGCKVTQGCWVDAIEPTMRCFLLLASVAAFAPARYARRPSALSARLEGEAKQAIGAVRERIGVREEGEFYDLDKSPWTAIRADFPALAALSDKELRAAIVAPGDPIDILVKTPLLPLLAVNLAILAARSQFGGLCGTLLADPSCRL